MPGYPQDLLSNRSVVKADFAIITPQGRVINTVPGIVDAKMTILCSPKIGAGFVQLIGTLGATAHTDYPYGAKEHEEAFIYVLDGEVELEVDVAGEKRVLTQGGSGQGHRLQERQRQGRPHPPLQAALHPASEGTHALERLRQHQ